MPDFKLISADSHVNEPPQAWERVQKEFGDRAPRVVKDPPGLPAGTWLITEGIAPMGVSHYSIGIAADKPQGISQMDISKWQDTVNFNANFSFEAYPEGWEPKSRIAAQDKDGVAAEVIFASPTRFFYGLDDGDLQRSIFHSYNAWLNDFCSYAPDRLIGLPLLSILDINLAIKDIYEYANLGFKGIQIPTAMREGGWYEEKYEPIWAALNETNLPINIHTNSIQGVMRTNFGQQRDIDPRTVSIGAPIPVSLAQTFLGHLTFSGVFDRYPALRVVCAEFNVAWVAALYQEVDFWHSRASAYEGKSTYELPVSEYFKRNMFFTFQDDRAGILATEIFGEDNYVWASDYPHGVTTWPYSHATVERNFKGIDPAIMKKICRDNITRVYNLDPSKLD